MRRLEILTIAALTFFFSGASYAQVAPSEQSFDYNHPISVAALRLMSTVYKSCDALDESLNPLEYKPSPAAACDAYDIPAPSYNQDFRDPHIGNYGNFYSVHFNNSRMDCSSLTSSIVLSAGLLLHKHQVLKTEHQPATPEMINWGRDPNDCFEPALIDGSTKFIKPGDLVVSGDPSTLR